MTRYQRLSLKYKLIFIITFISVVSIFATTSALMVSGIETLKSIIKNELTVTTTVIGEGSIASLLFDDKEFAEESLSGFKSNNSVKFSCLYDDEGEIFAVYPQNTIQKKSCPDPKQNIPSASFFEDEYVKIFHEIKQGSRRIGYIFVVSDLSKITSYKNRQIMSAFIIIFTATIAVAFLAFILQGSISSPLKRLVDVTNDYKLMDISNEGGDNEINLPVPINPLIGADATQNEDGNEIERLTQVFNLVLARSEATNKELIEHKSEKNKLKKEIDSHIHKYKELMNDFDNYKKTHYGFIKNHQMTLAFLKHEAQNYQLSAEININALNSGLYRPLDKDYVDSLSKNVSSALNMCETIVNINEMESLEKQLLSENKLDVNISEFVNFHIDRIFQNKPNLQIFPIDKSDIQSNFSCYKTAFSRMIKEILTLFQDSIIKDSNYFIKASLGQVEKELCLFFEFSSMTKVQNNYEINKDILDIDNVNAKRKLYSTRFFCNLNNGKMNIELSKSKAKVSIFFPYKTV